MVQLNRRFWNDEQIWDAYKDVRGGGSAKGCRSESGRTRLLFTAVFGKLERLRFYLDRGANVDLVLLKSNVSALMTASGNGHLGVVRELCERGANVNAATTNDSYTALMIEIGRAHV